MARRYFANENPIGHRIGMVNEEPGVDRIIVGVVKDMKFSSRDDVPAAAVYLPYAQAPQTLRGQAEIKVNTLLDSAVMIPAIRNEVQAVAGTCLRSTIVTDQELQDYESREERSLARVARGIRHAGLRAGDPGSLRHGRLFGVAAHARAGHSLRTGCDPAQRAVDDHGRHYALRVLGCSPGLGSGRRRIPRGRKLPVRSARVRSRHVRLVDRAFMTVTALIATYLPAWRAGGIDPMAVLKRVAGNPSGY